MNGGQLDSRGLTIKQRKFVKHYAATNGNGTKAARLAGYSQHRDPGDPATEKALSVVACENLGKPKVRAELERTMRKALSPDEVLAKLADIAEKTPDFKGSDTLKALELIGRFHKMFTDKTEISSPQDELKSQIIQEMAQKYGLTEEKARDIVADVYGEDLASESVQ